MPRGGDGCDIYALVKIEVGSVDENGWIDADVLLRRIFSLCQTDGKITWCKDFFDRMKKSSRYYPEIFMLFFFAFYKVLRMSDEILIQKIDAITIISFTRARRLR